MWDRSVPSSETSNFRLLIMTSGSSAFSLLKLANTVAEELNSPVHTLGASGFSCAVSRSGQVLKSDPRETFFLEASPLVSSAFGRRNEAPRRTREKTSSTLGTPFTVFINFWHWLYLKYPSLTTMITTASTIMTVDWFSFLGRLISTGSVDASIKVI